MSPATPWGSEDESALAARHASWSRLRASQMSFPRAPRALLVFGVALGSVGLYRSLAWVGREGRRGVAWVLLAWAAWTAWTQRSPKRTLEWHEGEFTDWPWLGQVGWVLRALRTSSLRTQLEDAQSRGFVTNELDTVGGIRDYSLMDVKDREYYLKTNWKNFTKNMPGTVMGFQDAFAEVLGRGIFAVDGDEWQDHRKVASHLFSANGLKSKMEASFRTHADVLVHLLQIKADANQEFDFQECAQALTFDTISDIAFGSFPGALHEYMTKGAKVDFLVRFDRLQQLCTLRFFTPESMWRLMRWLDVGPERQLREDAEQVRAYVQRVVDARRGARALEGDDLLSMYIKTARAGRKAYMEEDAYLSDAVLNFMIAGRDTTSCTLINLFKFLHEFPDVAAKMREEFDRVVGRTGNVSWDHVRELRYGGAVFNEVLRLRPPVYGDTRICNEDCTFPSGMVVPKGSYVSILNASIGHDPHLWPEPERFMPERWLQDVPPNEPVRRVDEFLHPVFWGGPRLCLGKDMARLETLALAHRILASFDVAVVSGQDDEIVNGPVQFYRDGVRVRVVAR